MTYEDSGPARKTITTATSRASPRAAGGDTRAPHCRYVVILLAGQGRGDLARRDSVDRDSVLRELQDHHLGEYAEAALGCA